MNSPNRLSYTQFPTVKRTISGTREKVVILPPQEVIPTRSQLVQLMKEDTVIDLPSLELSQSDILEEEYVLQENDIEEELLIVQEEWLEVLPIRTLPASMPPLPTEPPSPDTWLEEAPTLKTPSVPCLQMYYHRAPAATDLDLVPGFAWSEVGYLMQGDEAYVCQVYIYEHLCHAWKTQDGFVAQVINDQ